MHFGDEFRKFAVKGQGISSTALDAYTNYIGGVAQPIQNMTRAVIEERERRFAEIDVFSRLIMDRIIFMGTEVNDTIANIVIAQLLFLESADPDKDVLMYINSPGGSVYAGYGMYDTMQYIKPEINTICTGLAASFGAVLLAAGEKGKRSALPHARIMIHQPLGGAQGQASDIEITHREIQKMKKEIYETLASHTGQSYEQIWEDSDRDKWMTAEEAAEYGLIDEVLKRRKDK